MSFLKPSRPLEPNPPLTTDASRPEDIAASSALIAYLNSVAPLADEANTRHREVLLGELLQLFRGWVRDVGIAKGAFADEEAAAEAGGTIFVSGSFKLGVNTPDGDIDAICIAPQHVNRDDFFTTLPPLLRAHPGISDILPIPEAKVPIIELVFQDVSIDLLFASVPLNSVPSTLNILDDSILQGLDEASMITLNGPRVTELMFRAVPDPESFKEVLRALRHWAKVRGIYSNKMGFLGGVNFGLLAAFVCQLYPKFSPAALLHRFFLIFRDWPWPAPVKLTRPYTLPLGFPVWDPEHNFRDRKDVMPIITPAYPCSNSSYNVSKSTLAVMTLEVSRGCDVIDVLLREGGIPGGSYDWSSLFSPSDFFLRFDSYLVLDISADDEAELPAWKGFVESRVRKLVEALEFERLPLSLIYPFPKAFSREDSSKGPVVSLEDTAFAASNTTTSDTRDVSLGKSDCAIRGQAESADTPLLRGQPGSADTPLVTDAGAHSAPVAQDIERRYGEVVSLAAVNLNANRESGLASDTVSPPDGNVTTAASESTPGKLPSALGLGESPAYLRDSSGGSGHGRPPISAILSRRVNHSSYTDDDSRDEPLTESEHAQNRISLADARGHFHNPVAGADHSSTIGDAVTQQEQKLSYAGTGVTIAQEDVTVIVAAVADDTATSVFDKQVTVPASGSGTVVVHSISTKPHEVAMESCGAHVAGHTSNASLVPDVAFAVALRPIAAQPEQNPSDQSHGDALATLDYTSTPALMTGQVSNPATLRTVYSYYIGVQPDRERLNANSKLNLTPVLRTFKAMSLLNWAGWRPGMSVRQRMVAWRDLPEDVLPEGGRAFAATARQAARLSRSNHTVAVLTSTATAHATAGLAPIARTNVWVRSNGGLGSSGSAQVASASITSVLSSVSTLATHPSAAPLGAQVPTAVSLAHAANTFPPASVDKITSNSSDVRIPGLSTAAMQNMERISLHVPGLGNVTMAEAVAAAQQAHLIVEKQQQSQQRGAVALSTQVNPSSTMRRQVAPPRAPAPLGVKPQRAISVQVATTAASRPTALHAASAHVHPGGSRAQRAHVLGADASINTQPGAPHDSEVIHASSSSRVPRGVAATPPPSSRVAPYLQLPSVTGDESEARRSTAFNFGGGSALHTTVATPHGSALAATGATPQLATLMLARNHGDFVKAAVSADSGAECAQVADGSGGSASRKRPQPGDDVPRMGDMAAVAEHSSVDRHMAAGSPISVAHVPAAGPADLQPSVVAAHGGKNDGGRSSQLPVRPWSSAADVMAHIGAPHSTSTGGSRAPHAPLRNQTGTAASKKMRVTLL